MSTTPPIQYLGPAISPEVPWEVRQHLQLLYQKLGNHTQAMTLLQQNVSKVQAGGTTTTVYEGTAGGGGGSSTAAGIAVNDQSGETSYATQSGDNLTLILFSDASAIAVSLATQSPPWCAFIANIGAIGQGTVTLTPATGTINGEATLAILPTYWALVAFDGTNWWAAALPIVPTSFAAVAHQWLNSYNAATGVFTAAQPAFSDISGTVAPGQLPTPTASALGGVEAAGPTAHEWISEIDTSGVPHLSQPAFTDISGTATTAQIGTGTPSSGEYVDGGTGAWTTLPIVSHYQSVTSASYSTTAQDRVVGVNVAGAVTITLVSAASVPVGTLVYVKDESGSAGTYNITINPQSGQTIDGASSQVISVGHDMRRMYSSGSNWFLI